MNKLFAIFFIIIGLCICLFIASVIPLQMVGNNIIKKAKKHNIDITSNDSWTINPITLRGTTNKIEYNIDIDKSNISGYGNNFTCSLLNGDVIFENIVLEIYIDENDDLLKIFKNFKKKIANKYYSIVAKNVSISIFSKNTETQDAKIIEEFLINNLVITKHKDVEIYKANIGINKNEKMTFMTTIDRPNTETYELNAKLENSNFFCYIHDAKKNGTINCLNRNTFKFIKDIYDEEINSDFIKKLLEKRISLKANILHDQNNHDNIEIIGNLTINNNIGQIKYESKNNLIKIDFDDLDLDKTLNNIENLYDDDSEQEEYANIISMSGKENKIISSAKKNKQSENINSFKKIILYIIEFMNTKEVSAKVNIKQTIIDKIPIKNFNIDISKKANRQIDINNISATFGTKLDNKILITNKQNREKNLFIGGSNISEFLKLFNINFLNQSINASNYYILGQAKLSTSSIDLQDIACYIDERKIFNYSLSKIYSYERKKTTNNQQLMIQNIDINKYFNILRIYQNLYEYFENFQQQEKQDAVFWKYLFEKRNKNNFFKLKNQTITINNSILYGKKIKYFVIESKDDNRNTDITIATDGDVLTGQTSFNIKNIDDKEIIVSNIDIRNLLIKPSEKFYNDIKIATNRKLSDIFYTNKDYNIPSMIGLNGIFNIKIDHLSYNNTLFTDINGQIKLNNGVFTTENLKFKYKDGEINSNMAFSLQGRPELQIAIAGSGFYLNDVANTQVYGRISFQIALKTFGFNPIKFTKEMSGNGHIVLQNIRIPNFDLLHMSSEIITNGIRNGYNYMDIVKRKPLIFAKGEGNILVEDGIVKGDVSFSRELVSSRLLFEYNISNDILNQLTGSFAIMVTKKRGSTPFPIYIPFSCNGTPERPKCIINWDQLNEVLSNNNS